MTTKIIFYSRTGNTKKLAELISKKEKGDLIEIKDKKNRKGVVGWLSGGKDSAKGKETQIELSKPLSIKKGDIIYIGSPVWVGTMAPAILTFLRQNKKELEKATLVFFGTGSAKEAQKLFVNMQKESKTARKTIYYSTKEIQSKKVSL
jgi:flavodoxin